MAKFSVRYLICRKGARGEPPRYFWQPSSELRDKGFKSERLPENWRDLHDSGEIEAAAIAAARALNSQVDAWRAAGASPLAKAAIIPEREPRTLAALIAKYKTSNRFTGKAPKTQTEYSRCLKKLEAWGGDMPVRRIATPELVEFYEMMFEKTPAEANALMRVAGIVFAHARLLGWRTDNPAAKLGLVGSTPGGLAWPPEAVTAFVAAADAMGRPSIGTAILVNEWLGQREADVLAMPSYLLGPRGLLVRQRKTGAGVALPIAIVPRLVARIEAELERQRDRGHIGLKLIVSEETGEPYKADNFRHVFAQIRARVAALTKQFPVDYLPPGNDPAENDAFTVATTDLWFMHLRHTAVVRLAEAGCTNAEISSITGHSLVTVEQILKRYLIRTGAQATAAFTKRLAAEGRTP